MFSQTKTFSSETPCISLQYTLREIVTIDEGPARGFKGSVHIYSY